MSRGGKLTDLNTNQSNDNLFKTFCVPARDRFLEKLKHVLKDLLLLQLSATAAQDALSEPEPVQPTSTRVFNKSMRWGTSR